MILVKARINNLDVDTECDDSKFEIPHFVIPYQQSGSPNQQNGSPLQQNWSQNQQVLNPFQQRGSSRIDKGGRANYMAKLPDFLDIFEFWISAKAGPKDSHLDLSGILLVDQ